MSYRVIQDEQGRYNIQETSTDEIIRLSRPKEQEVRDLCRKLNLDGHRRSFHGNLGSMDGHRRSFHGKPSVQT
jgi:hypothetical protein